MLVETSVTGLTFVVASVTAIGLRNLPGCCVSGADSLKEFKYISTANTEEDDPTNGYATLLLIYYIPTRIQSVVVYA